MQLDLALVSKMRARASRGDRHVPKAAQDWGFFKELSARNDYSGLQALAYWLNDRSGLGRASRRAFEPIFAARSPLEAVRRFNQRAARLRFHLTVTPVRREGKIVEIPEIGGASNMARAILMIWEWYFSPHRARLKRCRECAAFFVDNARPNNSQRCSSLCTWRWWNRKRSAAKARSRRTR
jgi:hypothetical protein